jgi:hypothetical protein
MKYKLKELNFDTVNFNLGNSTDYGKVFNINDIIEFQTPKVIFEKVLKEDDKEYLILSLLPTEASKIFYSKINEFEEMLKKFGKVNSIFNGETFKVKVPFRNGNPLVKIYNDYNLLNYYSLKSKVTLIILLNISKIWTNSETVSYNLNAIEVKTI